MDGLEFMDVPLEVLLESLTPDSLGELRLGYLDYEENVHDDSKLGGKDCFFEVLIDNEKFKAVGKCVFKRFKSCHMDVDVIRGFIDDAIVFFYFVVEFVGGLELKFISGVGK